MQNPQCQRDHLEIFTPGSSRDIPRLCTNIVDNGLLQPRHQEMSPLIDDLFLHISNLHPISNILQNQQTNLLLNPSPPIKNNSSSSTLDVIYAQLKERNSDSSGNRQAGDDIESSRHVFQLTLVVMK